MVGSHVAAQKFALRREVVLFDRLRVRETLEFGSVSRTLAAGDGGTRLGRLAAGSGMRRAAPGRRGQRTSAQQRKQGMTAETHRHGVRRTGSVSARVHENPGGQAPNPPGSGAADSTWASKILLCGRPQCLRHAYCRAPIAQLCAVPHGRTDGRLRSCAGHRYVAIPYDSLGIHIIQTIRGWPFGAKNSKQSSRHRDRRPHLDQNRQEKQPA
jgi:hypothetical protein